VHVLTSAQLATALGDGARTVEWSVVCDCGGMITDPRACWGCWIPCQWDRPQMVHAAPVYAAIRSGEYAGQGLMGEDPRWPGVGYLVLEPEHDTTRLALALAGWARVPRVASERHVFAFGDRVWPTFYGPHPER
jgi:hypothetical protein